MKTYVTPVLLIALLLSLAVVIGATAGTDASRAQSPARPTSTRITTTMPSPAAGAHLRVVHRPVTRAACRHLFAHDSDSHGELGSCLASAR
jgi:hypothetical protein